MGLRNLAPHADVVVVVDVLSFTTAVDVALGRGAVVYPYRWHDGSEHVEACLRNAAAVAAAFSDTGHTVGVVAAGERWRGATGPMRVALEDLLGAGAVLAGFDSADCSPEALAAVAVWRDAEPDLRDRLLTCASGRRLVERGFGDDVTLAARAHVSDLVPTLVGDRFVDGEV